MMAQCQMQEIPHAFGMTRVGTNRYQYEQIMRIFLLIVINLIGYNFCLASPIPASEAFVLNYRIVDNNALLLQWHIKEGYFLYKDRVHIHSKPLTFSMQNAVILPPPTDVYNRYGKKTAVYSNDLSIEIPASSMSFGKTSIHIEYQGCAATGYCYPPQNKTIFVEKSLKDEMPLIFTSEKP